MSLITFQGVDYSVGGPLLLESVDLTIERNERVCIVGRNGAGKSTLLRLMGGAITPDDGVVKREGRLAGLAQEVPKDLAGSVFDVVAMGLGALGADLARYHHLLHDGDDIDMDELGAVQARIEAGDGWQIEQRVEQVISKLALPEDAEFSALSGGMKRRVLIGKALSHGPRVLFLDEPTAGVDVNLRREMWAVVRDLRADGVTIILTTHYLEEAEEMADRIGIIDKGKLLLMQDTAKLMHEFGRKRLIVELVEPLAALPEALAGHGLTLAADGTHVSYDYDTRADRSGIARLLAGFAEAGIGVRDLETEQSSLEEVFLRLVEEGA